MMNGSDPFAVRYCHRLTHCYCLQVMTVSLIPPRERGDVVQSSQRAPATAGATANRQAGAEAVPAIDIFSLGSPGRLRCPCYSWCYSLGIHPKPCISYTPYPT